MKRIALPLILLFFGLFLFYPLADLFHGAFFYLDERGQNHFTLLFFFLLLKNALFRAALLNSLCIASLTTLGTFSLALPLAVLFSRFRFPGRELLRAGMIAPLILPPFVGALGLKHLLGRFGSLNLLLAQWHLVSLTHPPDWFGSGGLAGVILLEVLHLFPIFFLSIFTTLVRLDPSWLEAAANLGASAARRFRTVTLPLAAPGIVAGACLVFISAFTDLGTPLIFNLTATVPTLIFAASVDAASEPIGYALVVVTLVLVLGFFLLVRRMTGQESVAVSVRPGPQTGEKDLPWGGLATAGVLCLLGFALLPQLGVVLSSVADHWFFTIWPDRLTTASYAAVFQDPLTRISLLNSLLYSSLSAVLDLALGLLIAHLLARENFPGKALLDAVVMLPLALPGLVLAFALLMSFNLHGWVQWINPRTDPTFLLVISYALRRLPYIVRSARAGYEQIPVELEEASANLGVGRWRTLRRITLPLLWPNLLAGTLLTFCFAMLEVSDSLILAMEARFAPITRGIYEMMGRPSPDSVGIACALGVVAMLILGSGVLLGSRLLGDRLGSLFRA